MPPRFTRVNLSLGVGSVVLGFALALARVTPLSATDSPRAAVPVSSASAVPVVSRPPVTVEEPANQQVVNSPDGLPSVTVPEQPGIGVPEELDRPVPPQ